VIEIYSQISENKLTGDYFGQTPPSNESVLFAPGIISTKHHEHSSPTFSPDGNEVLWSLWERPQNDKPQLIMHIVRKNGVWSTPQVASFSGNVLDGGPVISSDGSKLFIYRQEQIVYFTKVKSEWVNPTPIIEGFSFSVAKNGNIYYSGKNDAIYKIEFKDNKYLNPKLLNESINKSGYLNWTPYVAPDESYLIFSRCDRNGDYGNLYICFKSKTKDDWTDPVDMGESINTWAQERFPSVSPDGKYLFFCRSQGSADDVFWVSTNVIKSLKDSIKE